MFLEMEAHGFSTSGSTIRVPNFNGFEVGLCKKGHIIDEDNFIVRDNKRRCLTCYREGHVRRNRRAREKARENGPPIRGHGGRPRSATFTEDPLRPLPESAAIRTLARYLRKRNPDLTTEKLVAAIVSNRTKLDSQRIRVDGVTVQLEAPKQVLPGVAMLQARGGSQAAEQVEQRGVEA